MCWHCDEDLLCVCSFANAAVAKSKEHKSKGKRSSYKYLYLVPKLAKVWRLKALQQTHNNSERLLKKSDNCCTLNCDAQNEFCAALFSNIFYCIVSVCLYAALQQCAANTTRISLCNC